MGRRTKVDKRLLWDTVEKAYSEGIGCRRPAAMIGYAPFTIRTIARDMSIPPLPRHAAGIPSEELRRRIAKVKRLVDEHDAALKCGLPVAGIARPNET